MAGLILLRYEHRALEERDVEEHGALRGAELDMAGTEESMEEGGLQVAAARASRSTATMQGYAIEEDLLTTHNRASRVRGTICSGARSFLRCPAPFRAVLL
eukprot:scaffold480_cov257-Pinguiococcus_pyrenoidosus.AAC.17